VFFSLLSVKDLKLVYLNMGLCVVSHIKNMFFYKTYFFNLEEKNNYLWTKRFSSDYYIIPLNMLLSQEIT
jgi:hypothetical protein